MTKVYQLRRQFAACFETSYCGTPVQLLFASSIGNSGENRGELITSDRFTQDAIEHDPRFGKEFYLVEQYGEPDPEPQAEEQEPEPEPQPKKKAATKKKVVKESEETVSEDKTFKTMNDAIYYLEEELGIETEGKDINTLLKENNITVKA